MPNILTWRARDLKKIRKLGDGGEGEVWEVEAPASANSVRVAFKQYNDEARRVHGPATLEKLSAMIAHPPVDPSPSADHRTFLWPRALVLTDSHTLAGYCMTLLEGPEWHSMVSIVDAKARKKNGVTHWTWGARAAICLNMSRAVQALHQAGVAWGDLNETNIKVNRRGLVTLLDLDTAAFVEPGGRVHPGSGFTREDWRPPEYGERATFTQEGDNWALAVQIYITLMESYRPYAAAGYEFDTPSEFISHGLFPILDPKIPPPAESPPLDLLPPKLANNFRTCFGAGRTKSELRPAPGAYVAALEELTPKKLRTCRDERTHQWAPPRTTCPWCERLVRVARAHAAAATKAPNATATTAGQAAARTTPATPHRPATAPRTIITTPTAPTAPVTVGPTVAAGFTSAQAPRAPLPPAPNARRQPSRPTHRRRGWTGRAKRVVGVLAGLIVAGAAAVALVDQAGGPDANGNTSPTLTPDEYLTQRVQGDAAFVDQQALGNWVPQLASWDASTTSSDTILAATAQLDQQYGVALLNTSAYVFASQNHVVAVAKQSFADPGGALAWCSQAGLTNDNCYAKLITHDTSITDTVEYSGG
jgi:hypothetical protein